MAGMMASSRSNSFWSQRASGRRWGEGDWEWLKAVVSGGEERGPRCRVVGGPGAPDARGAHVARGAPGSTGARCAPAQAARAAQPAHPARFAHLAPLAHSRGPSTDQIARAAQPIRRICAVRYLPDLVLIQSRSDRSSESPNCLSGRPRAGAPAPWRGRQPWPWRPRTPANAANAK